MNCYFKRPNKDDAAKDHESAIEAKDEEIISLLSKVEEATLSESTALSGSSEAESLQSQFAMEKQQMQVMYQRLGAEHQQLQANTQQMNATFQTQIQALQSQLESAKKDRVGGLPRYVFGAIN